MTRMKRIVLATRPEAKPGPEHFRLEEGTLALPGPGQFAARTIWLSLDPYMRGRMSAAKSYAKPVEIGETMTAQVVAEVTVSNHPGFAPGDLVVWTCPGKVESTN